MAQLIVRRLEDEVVKKLKIRAAENGRSAEAEHREILRETLLADAPARSLGRWLLEMPGVGDDDDFSRSPDLGREVDL